MPMTAFTATGDTSSRTAARLARTDPLTPSGSLTVVPAKSKTTSFGSMSGPPEFPVDQLLGHSERERHPRAADAGDGHDVRGRPGGDDRFGRVLEVDAVPAGGDVQVGQVEEGPQVAEDQLVDRGLVERLDGVVVLVGVAEHDLAPAVLRRHDVDAVAVELGRLGGDPGL